MHATLPPVLLPWYDTRLCGNSPPQALVVKRQGVIVADFTDKTLRRGASVKPWAC